MVAEAKEIGTTSNISLDDRDYLLHVQGRPIELASFIKTIMEKRKLNQSKAAEYLRESGFPITQAQISRLLSILKLEPELLRLLKIGAMGDHAAFELTKIPRERRKALIQRVKSGDLKKITIKVAQEERDQMVASPDLLQLVSAPSPLFDQVDVWWRGLSLEEKQRLYRWYKEAKG